MSPRRVGVRLQDLIECLSGSLRRRPAEGGKEVSIVWVLCKRVLQANNVLRGPALVIRGGATLARQVGRRFRKLIGTPPRGESRRTAEIIEQVRIVGLPLQSSMQRRNRAAE